MLPTDPGFYKNLLDHMSDGVYFVDRNRTITYWNKGAHRLTGYSAEEVVGRQCQDEILAHIDCRGTNLCQAGCPLSAAICDGDAHEARVFLRHRQGHRIPVLVRVQPIRDDSGNIVGAIEIFSDDSAQTEAQNRIEEMRRMAYLDHLTQLPNRRYLEVSLESAFSEFRMTGRPFGLIAIDMDSFKEINDRYGHSQGDQVLQTVARTLSSSLRARDIVGRWGGDEFVALIPRIDEAILRKLCGCCVSMVGATTLTTVDGTVLQLSVSVGATLAWPGATIDDLFRRADQMMYISKSNGRGRFTLSSTSRPTEHP